MKKNMIKRMLCMLTCSVMMLGSALTVCAEETIPGYNYNVTPGMTDEEFRAILEQSGQNPDGEKVLDVYDAGAYNHETRCENVALRIDAHGMTPTEFQAAMQNLTSDNQAEFDQKTEAKRQEALARGIDLHAVPKKTMDGTEYTAIQVTPNGTYIYAEWFAAEDDEVNTPQMIGQKVDPVFWSDTMLNAIDAAGITNNMSDYDKCVAINNYVCSILEYDYSLTQRMSYKKAMADGMGVCEDYARIFQRMCYMVGVDCDRVRGKSDGGDGWDGHVWNRVFVDGTVYYIDSTWNDITGNEYLMSTTVWPNHKMEATDRATTNGK